MESTGECVKCKIRPGQHRDLDDRKLRLRSWIMCEMCYNSYEKYSAEERNIFRQDYEPIYDKQRMLMLARTWNVSRIIAENGCCFGCLIGPVPKNSSYQAHPK